ncbi:hypothetical protein BJX63DRAFT_435459 [Aspergillus granulosus]|uniref:Rhodopsin domain-containing protein n=1 Tax=Aspergillus granulosus TaxID=176169 RepID=A0ABR4H115_9EURO
MAYEPSDCAIVAIVVLALAWICVTIRLYVRLYLQRNLAVDDILAVSASAIFTALAVRYVIGILRDGLGKHDADLSRETYARGMHAGFTCVLLFFASTCLMKLSFIYTLFRVVQTRIYQYVLYALTLTGGILTICVGFWTLFYCDPIKHFWERPLPTVGPGHCKSVASLRTTLLVHAAWILTADLTLGLIIPSLLLKNLRVPLPTKISAWVLLGLGSVASIATIIRIIYLPRLSDEDSLYVNNPAVLWSSIEVATNIICTSAMTWKPLMVKWGIVHNSQPSTHGQRYAQARGGSEQHSFPLQPKDDIKWPTPHGRAIHRDPTASTELILYDEVPTQGGRRDKDGTGLAVYDV